MLKMKQNRKPVTNIDQVTYSRMPKYNGMVIDGKSLFYNSGSRGGINVRLKNSKVLMEILFP